MHLLTYLRRWSLTLNDFLYLMIQQRRVLVELYLVPQPGWRLRFAGKTGAVFVWWWELAVDQNDGFRTAVREAIEGFLWSSDENGESSCPNEVATRYTYAYRWGPYKLAGRNYLQTLLTWNCIGIRYISYCMCPLNRPQLQSNLAFY